MPNDALVNALGALIAKHEPTGREFIAAAIRAAEGYFERDELPALVDVQALADELRNALREEA